MVIHQSISPDFNPSYDFTYSYTIDSSYKILLIFEHPWQYCAISAYMVEPISFSSIHPAHIIDGLLNLLFALHSDH